MPRRIDSPTLTSHSWRYLLLALVFAATGARAANMPEGMKGWSYYIQPDQLGFVATPEKACALTAAKQMGTPLKYMTPGTTLRPTYNCFYSHFLVIRGVRNYGDTILHCHPGYVARSPGVCLKQAEPSRPPSCSPDQPGFTLGNPVALASGAKVQAETDLPGTAGGTLRVTRTYRSVRDIGAGQSAGQAWSFSFDRQFTVEEGLFGEPAAKISGALGDGSYFEFHRLRSGAYLSRYDKRETLTHLTDALDDWVLTTSDGATERFKQINGQFLLVSSHTSAGLAQFYSYTPENKLATIADAGGRTLSIAWEGGAVASIAGPGGSVRYRYELSQGEDGAPVPGTEQLAAVEFLDEAQRPLASRLYHYEDPNYRHLLTGITDENGVRFATYAYNATAQAVLSEHAGGAGRYTFAYPDAARRIVTDPLGSQSEIGLAYGRDSMGRVTGASRPAGAGCGPGYSALAYDELGRPASSTDFNDNKTCYVTEPVRGLVTSRVTGLAAHAACPASDTDAIAPGSRRTSSQWHPGLELETAVAGPRQITRYVYNGEPGADGAPAHCADNATLPNGKPIAVLCSMTVQATRDADGAQGFAAQPDGAPRTWRYQYNAAGQLLKRTGPADANGQAATLTRTYYADTTASHAKGDLASTQNAAGEVTRFLEYTPDGLASKIRRADGVLVNLAYGARQRLASSTIENGKGGAESTHYSYDRAGQLTRLVSPDGSALAFAYDDAHRLTGLADGAGNRVQLTLDAMGNVTRQEVRDAAGTLVRETIRAFDALNRLASVQRDAQSPATTFQYDRAGNLTALRDGLGRITTSQFDKLDRRTNVALPPAAPGKPAAAIVFAYDHQDNLVGVTDPRALTTSYAFDGYGQRTRLASPDSATTSYQFDDAGKLAAVRDGRGIATARRYDAAGRPTAIGASTFAYGKDGTPAAGRLAAMSDASGNSSFSYDGFGRLQASTQTVGTGNGARQFTLAYTYGASGAGTGHVTSVTYPSGKRIDIAYGSNGQASGFTLAAPAAHPVALLSNIQYAALGAVQGWTWGGPHSSRQYRREFDSAGRIKRYPLGQAAENGSVRTLHYDAADRITSTVHSGAPHAAALDQQYTYDDLDRLTRVEGQNLSQAFAYDDNGNRIEARFGSASYRNTVHPASNRLSATSGPAPAHSNTYDNAGNLTSDGNARYSYGADGRLAAADVAGALTSYRYNGFGQRVAKVAADGNTTYYVYDAAGRLLGEYDRDANAIQETVYLDDLPVAVLKAGAVYAVYADHILTPRVITPLGESRMVWRWDSADPFGLQQPDDSPEGLPRFTYNPRFPGQVYDQETNTHYNYFRDYDARTGRYLQSDPIGLAGGINTYAYAAANPVSNIDPSGLACPPKLKEMGACIDSSNFDPQVDCRPDVRASADTDLVAINNAHLLDISKDDEHAGTISKTNVFRKVKISGAETDEGYEAEMEVDSNAAAIMHSHPQGNRYSPAPGHKDNRAIMANLPNYVTRLRKTSVLELVDGQYQFRTLSGTLTEAERRSTQAQLDIFQSNSRGRSCRCQK